MRRPRPPLDRRPTRTEISYGGVLEAPGAWPLACRVGACRVVGGDEVESGERREMGHLDAGWDTT